MAVALARFALKFLVLSVLAPLLLNKTVAALVTLVSASVVLTSANQTIGFQRVSRFAVLCVSVANTATTNRYVADAVKVSSRHRRILFSNSHQMSKKSFGSHQTQSNVCGSGPILQSFRIAEISRTWSLVHQGSQNLQDDNIFYRFVILSNKK